MQFLDLVNAQNKKYKRTYAETHRLLCFDPGHTTGWAYFYGCELAASGQINTKNMETAPFAVKSLFDLYMPDTIVCEDYRVYSWRSEHHIGSEMLTTRVIGCIETIASFGSIPLHKRMAVLAKKFCDDKKLKEWNFYKKGERHARDAIRHGCYHIIFYNTSKQNNPHKPKSSNTVG